MDRPKPHSRPVDTRPDAHAIQIAIYRRLTPEERTALAVEMSEEARRVTLDGIQSRFPDWDEERCRRELFRRIHGRELFDRAWNQAEHRG